MNYFKLMQKKVKVKHMSSHLMKPFTENLTNGF